VVTRTYRRIFQTDPKKLEEMLRRYDAGETSSALGRAYGCDHTTILHHVKKRGLWKNPGKASGLLLGRPTIFSKQERRGSGREITWDGFEHTCCTSHYPTIHKVRCPRIPAGKLMTEFRQGRRLKPAQTHEVAVAEQKPHKYQHLFDREFKTRPAKTYKEIYAAALKRGDRSLLFASKPAENPGDIDNRDIHT
jgi:hypothetical protein